MFEHDISELQAGKIPVFEIRYQSHALKRRAMNGLVTYCGKRASFARQITYVFPSELKCEGCRLHLF